MKSLLRQLREAFPEVPLPERPVTDHRCPDCDRAEERLGGHRGWVVEYWGSSMGWEFHGLGGSAPAARRVVG